MGHKCQCGSELKSNGKRNIINHEKTHKHKKWQYGSDYKNGKLIETDIEVISAKTYGTCDITTTSQEWLNDASIKDISEMIAKKTFSKKDNPDPAKPTIDQLCLELKNRLHDLTLLDKYI